MTIYEELIKSGLALGASYLLYRFTLRQPRLTYFVSGFASCRVQTPTGPVVVWISQISIQNTGRAPARNVRIAHRVMPSVWQVIQTVTFTVEQVDGEDRIIRFDTIEPRMLVTIAYLDTDFNRITTAFEQVRSDDGVVRPTPVQLQRILSKRLGYVLAILLVMGAYMVISLSYGLIRWLWPIISRFKAGW